MPHTSLKLHPHYIKIINPKADTVRKVNSAPSAKKVRTWLLYDFWWLFFKKLEKCAPYWNTHFPKVLFAILNSYNIHKMHVTVTLSYPCSSSKSFPREHSKGLVTSFFYEVWVLISLKSIFYVITFTLLRRMHIFDSEIAPHIPKD
jgi:hypothetical protein